MKKKLEYIWFYYKVPIIIAIIVLFIFIDYKISTKNVEEYDNSVPFISTTFSSENELDNIKKYIRRKI